MRRLNCRPGELAIVINSFDPANIGSIVKVLGRDAKACEKKFFWRTHAAHTLNYAKAISNTAEEREASRMRTCSLFGAIPWGLTSQLVS